MHKSMINIKVGSENKLGINLLHSKNFLYLKQIRSIYRIQFIIELCDN